MRQRVRRGGLEIGPMLIPFLPLQFILTDRGTGTRYLLSFTTNPNGGDGLGYITLNTTLPTRPDKRTFAAGEEPVLGTNPTIRVFVRDGYLGMEIADLPRPTTDRDQAPIIARSGLLTHGRKLIIPTSWSLLEALSPVDGEIGWTDVDFTNG